MYSLHVLKQDGAAISKSCEDKFYANQNSGEKLYITKTLTK